MFERQVVLFSCNQASNHYGGLYIKCNNNTPYLYYKLFNSTVCKLPVQNVLEKSL